MGETYRSDGRDDVDAWERNEEINGGVEVDFDLDEPSAKRLLLLSLLWPSSLQSGELQQLAGAAASLFEYEARCGVEQRQDPSSSSRLRQWKYARLLD